MVDSTCPVPNCIDSQLSITANVIGILTFIGAVITAYLVASFQALSIGRELQEFCEDFESTAGQLSSCYKTLRSSELDELADRDTLENLMQLLHRARDQLKEMDKGIERIGIRRQYSKWKRLRTMVAGTALRDELNKSLKKAQQLLSEIQLCMIQL